jgi:acetyl-CoA acetyltransferase
MATQPVDDRMYNSAHTAAAQAMRQASITDPASQIDWFGLYDCFPICFIRAVEAVGLAAPGCGGEWVEAAYQLTSPPDGQALSTDDCWYSADDLPVNTHGGLLAFGAPWEVPAMHSIIEALEQLGGSAGARQLGRCDTALVYGNGGILSHSAVAVLGRAHGTRRACTDP